jgi:hypothetical protein
MIYIVKKFRHYLLGTNFIYFYGFSKKIIFGEHTSNNKSIATLLIFIT